MDTTEATAIDRATELGTEDGEAAASWLFDGNTDTSTYLRFLVGIEHVDPEAVDDLPTADLSGEWADGLTPASLAEACGVPECDWSLVVNAPMHAYVEDLCTAYESAFSEAVSSEVERIARAQVEDDTTTLGRLLSAVRTHSGLSYSEIRQAGEHGADCGWAGFTYTADSLSFYSANADDVWELLNESADDLGTSPLAMVASFNAADTATDAASFGNLLAWYALEEVGRWLSDVA